eukprot:TRINITY_DN18308_c0_g1_i1.p1 TRINITY_DN18308_c0_g1~~TRINITY_DN18308_c0_g1_i1.p1  ORF type:complete len:217 (+),score=32.65 TRINITY_DN18308_c0_g1_i1:81-731(+)
MEVGSLYKFVSRGTDDAGLAEQEGQLLLLQPAPYMWRLFRQAGDDEGWFRIAPSSYPHCCLDLFGSDRLAYLAPLAETTSGQLWKFTRENAVDNVYRLHSMWSGCNHLLTVRGDYSLALQERDGHSGAPGGATGSHQLWEVIDMNGLSLDMAKEEERPACTGEGHSGIGTPCAGDDPEAEPGAEPGDEPGAEPGAEPDAEGPPLPSGDEQEPDAES